ncbi:MAG: DUF4390 domain-containing protein [Desulfocapsaceae bacterium]|jgi:hypothetical protein|nr:DUF4390 domain-containing protein [Desulfocapsaceae bacterium]
MRLRYYHLFLFTFVFLLTVQTVFCEEADRSGPHITDIIVTTSDTHLLLFGELRNSLTKEMVDGLHSGIPITFSFFVELEKNEPNWPDEELVVFSFSHNLSFDTLKNIYVVETEENNNKKSTAATLDEAAQVMNEINGLRIIQLDRLRPDATYRIRVKADLYKKTLPMSLHTIIPFISWWDLSTDWYTVEFTY